MASLYVFLFLGCLVLINCQLSRLYTTRQQGDGTYYGANSGSGGACSIYPRPSFASNIPTVAMNAPQWANSGACGMCLQLSGSGKGSGANPITGTTLVMVDNLCPECKTGSLDLAKNGDGRWSINWIAVDCPTSGGLTYKFQGSNPYYLKMQIGNHKIPVQAVQFGKGGKWYGATRTSDNFFNPSGYPYPATFPLKVRVQGINGQWVDDEVPSVSTTPVKGNANIQFAGLKAAAHATDANSSQLNSGSPATLTASMIAVVVGVVVVVAAIIVVVIVLVVRSQNEKNALRP